MKKLTTVLFVFLFLLTAFSSASATRPLDNIQIGDYVNLGNQQFIKLNDNGLLMMSTTLTCPHGKRIAGQWVKCFECPEGSTYDSVNVACTCNNQYWVYDWDSNTCHLPEQPDDALLDNCDYPIAYFDNWQGCDDLSEFDTVCLLDRRDYRSYQVRKFADGKCWMVDNLKFGGNYGDEDGCTANNNMGNFGGGAAITPAKAQEMFVQGFYGHCRAATPPTSYIVNYYYDWVAALQNTLAYRGTTTAFTSRQQGLCPSGWHLPDGGSSGEFQALADYYGTNSQTGFWLEPLMWNGDYSGAIHDTLGSWEMSTHGYYWSGTSVSQEGSQVQAAYMLDINQESVVNPAFTSARVHGRVVRCVQD
ncbi:hypothetical protein IJI99_02755 [bacterium]|nr:hypothetical protein [bacterium]